MSIRLARLPLGVTLPLLLVFLACSEVATPIPVPTCSLDGRWVDAYTGSGFSASQVAERNYPEAIGVITAIRGTYGIDGYQGLIGTWGNGSLPFKMFSTKHETDVIDSKAEAQQATDALYCQEYPAAPTPAPTN